MELGWHPNLTLDAPVLPPGRISSLVDSRGRFWRLGTFMKKLFFGRLRVDEIAAELEAQLTRYTELVGQRPRLVNSHQHIGIFVPVGPILLSLLSRHQPRAYLRQVREPWSLIWSIKGARKKRSFLNMHGRWMGRRQEALGFPGNDWLGGITDPPWVRQHDFFEAWLRAIPGQTVELSCHPGYLDETLLGRDCERRDGMMERRARELELLCRPEFLQTAERAGFQLVSPTWSLRSEVAHAA
jgi:predicted glycoside hydrolase/deacetylase ChbG (UPF0249 family)